MLPFPSGRLGRILSSELETHFLWAGRTESVKTSRERTWLSGYPLELAGISGWAAQPCMFDIFSPRPK